MARNQGSLANLLGPKSPSTAHEPQRVAQADRHQTTFALELVSYNPYNPRAELGDVSELAHSMRESGQVQAATLVTRAAFLSAHPRFEGSFDPPDAQFVVVDGNRRRLAAETAGLATFKGVVDDGLAGTAADMFVGAMVANIHRQDFAPIEEARAVELLVGTLGTAAAVAKRLGKTEAWVSQRRSLLRLTPALQEKVSSGELKVKQARQIATLSPEEQEAAASEALGSDTTESSVPASRSSESQRARTSPRRQQSIKVGTPVELAAELRRALEPADLEKLVELLLGHVGR